MKVSVGEMKDECWRISAEGRKGNGVLEELHTGQGKIR